METIVIHAHGSQGAHSIRIPSNIVVYAISDATEFTAAQWLSHDFWHFAFSEIHEKLQRSLTTDTVTHYLKTMWEILQPFDNTLAAYPPGSMLPNVNFTFKDKTFQTGIFRLPLNMKSITADTLDIIKSCQPGEPGYDSAMHLVTHPKYRALVNQREYREVLSLHELIMHFRESQYFTLVFVLTCRTRRKGYLPDGPKILLSDTDTNIRMLKDAYRQLHSYSYNIDNRNIVKKLSCMRFSQKRKHPEDS